MSTPRLTDERKPVSAHILRNIADVHSNFEVRSMAHELLALRSERVKLVERLAEHRALIERALPFAVAEGRKTWAAEARTLLSSIDDKESGK